MKNPLLFIPVAATVMTIMLPTVAQTTGNDECMECHGDSTTERLQSKGVRESIQLNDRKFKYSSHNINGVGCRDCHADIGELNFDRDIPHSATLAPVDCASCHKEEVAAFEKSVHHQFSAKGLDIQCYACHDYHYLTSSIPESVSERENKSCLNCHNPFEHHNWLPQKGTHFDYVQCTVCHAPDAPRHIHLRFYDLAKKDFMASDAILKALETDIDGFFQLVNSDGDDRLSVQEFENMVFILKRRGIYTSFHGELLSEQKAVIHQVSRAGAKRECDTCHRPDSPFFKNVTLFFTGSNGDSTHFLVDRKVLETYSVSNFYAPGGTRVRELDYIGLVLCTTILFLVCAHLSVRILTLPLRTKRRESVNKPSAEGSKVCPNPYL